MPKYCFSLSLAILLIAMLLCLVPMAHAANSENPVESSENNDIATSCDMPTCVEQAFNETNYATNQTQVATLQSVGAAKCGSTNEHESSYAGNWILFITLSSDNYPRTRGARKLTLKPDGTFTSNSRKLQGGVWCTGETPNKFRASAVLQDEDVIELDFANGNVYIGFAANDTNLSGEVLNQSGIRWNALVPPLS